MELDGIKTTIKSRIGLSSQFGIQLNKKKYNHVHENIKLNVC